MAYSMSEEAQRILAVIGATAGLPNEILGLLDNVQFVGSRRQPYFPIPFKETEVSAALKAIEGCLVCAVADRRAPVIIDLDRTTAFLCQTYLSTVDGYHKNDPESKRYLKG